ncbi:unnamed protein product, partial [Brassica rapa]
MSKLTGLKREEVVEKMLLGEEAEKVPFGFFTRGGKYVECLLCVSKKLDREGAVTGVF